jgi:hypothetical protein
MQKLRFIYKQVEMQSFEPSSISDGMTKEPILATALLDSDGRQERSVNIPIRVIPNERRE